ncbi:MAG: helix-turn-helix domain-containing protein [Candidatus Solibacter usitatus]|nr:helix-turn-helix domain-containing protein [Candidatus Solibacter usitatus]
MSLIDDAISFAVDHSRRRGSEEVSADDLVLGCLRAMSRFGVAWLGELPVDLEEWGVDWLQLPSRSGAKLRYSEDAVALFDRAALIARSDLKQSGIGVEHLLAAASFETSALLQAMRDRRGLTPSGWRVAIARAFPRITTGQELAVTTENGENVSGAAPGRDYLTPEEAAQALGIHVQTLRGYIRSGRMPAFRLAGERAIRIRREDLSKVLEPLKPEA